MSVREQGHLIVDRLRRERGLTFRALTADAPDLITKVACFLALLELFKEGVIAFEQATPLGDLHLRWTGTDEGDIDVGDEFDQPTGSPDDETPPDLQLAEGSPHDDGNPEPEDSDPENTNREGTDD